MKQDEFIQRLEDARLREQHETLPKTKEGWVRERRRKQIVLRTIFGATVLILMVVVVLLEGR